MTECHRGSKNQYSLTQPLCQNLKLRRKPLQNKHLGRHGETLKYPAAALQRAQVDKITVTSGLRQPS